MKVLIVRAHPLAAPQSHSMAMTDEFVKVFSANHPDAEIHDLRLYDRAVPEIDVDLLTAWGALRGGEHFAHLSSNQQAKVTLFDGYTREFLDADLIVVANPLWNLAIPTRLKAWVDTVIVAGKTFRYTPDGQAEGLTTGKTVVHLQASGGHFGAQDPACQYIRGIFSFIGCDVKEITAEGMDHEPERADEIMAEVMDRVRELAGSL